MSEPQGQQAQLPKLDELVQRIPFMTISLYFTLISLWVFDLLFSFSSLHLVNDPMVVWKGKQIWRILTASFCQVQFMLLVITIINLHTILPKLELRMSSAWLLWTYLANGITIQAIYTIAYLLLPERAQAWLSIGCASGVWFNFMFKYCFFNRKTKIQFCCFPFKINKIFYPFAMLIILTLFNSFIFPLDAAIGVMLAAIECLTCKANEFPQRSLCDRLCSLLPCSHFNNWVPYDSSMQPIASPYQQIEEDMRQTVSTETTSMKDNVFNRSKGIRLDEA